MVTKDSVVSPFGILADSSRPRRRFRARISKNAVYRDDSRGAYCRHTEVSKFLAGGPADQVLLPRLGLVGVSGYDNRLAGERVKWGELGVIEDPDHPGLAFENSSQELLAARV